MLRLICANLTCTPKQVWSFGFLPHSLMQLTANHGVTGLILEKGYCALLAATTMQPVVQCQFERGFAPAQTNYSCLSLNYVEQTGASTDSEARTVRPGALNRCINSSTSSKQLKWFIDRLDDIIYAKCLLIKRNVQHFVTHMSLR